MTNFGKYPQNRGMNLTDGGDGTIGRKSTPEQKLKQREYNLKNKPKGNTLPRTEEEKQRLRLFLREINSKLGHPMLGKKHTEESKIKNRESCLKSGRNTWNTGVKYSKERTLDVRRVAALATGKPVLQVDFNGNIINEYLSIAEASRILGVAKNTITRVIKMGYLPKNLAFTFKFKSVLSFHNFQMKRRVFEQKSITI